MPLPDPCGRPEPHQPPGVGQLPVIWRAIFIYYKVAQEDAGRLQQAFARLVSTSSQAADVFRHAQLLRRAGDPQAQQGRSAEGGARRGAAHQGGAAPAAPELQTWMEVYWLDAVLGGAQPRGDGRQANWHHEAVAHEIDLRARAAGIVELVHGERHCEIFETCA